MQKNLKAVLHYNKNEKLTLCGKINKKMIDDINIFNTAQYKCKKCEVILKYNPDSSIDINDAFFDGFVSGIAFAVSLMIEKFKKNGIAQFILKFAGYSKKKYEITADKLNYDIIKKIDF